MIGIASSKNADRSLPWRGFGRWRSRGPRFVQRARALRLLDLEPLMLDRDVCVSRNLLVTQFEAVANSLQQRERDGLHGIVAMIRRNATRRSHSRHAPAEGRMTANME